MTGFKLIKSLLHSANSVMETLPRCLINLATSSSSFCDIYMNLPRSSITPVSSPEAWRSCILSMAAWVFSLKWAARSSSKTTFCACKKVFLNMKCHDQIIHEYKNHIEYSDIHSIKDLQC